MRNLLMVVGVVFMGWMSNAEAEPLAVDPESRPRPARLGAPPPGRWSAPMRYALLRVIDRSNGHGLASASIPHLTVRTPDGARPIMLEATFYPPVGADPAPLAIITHGSDVGRNQLRNWSFSTEAHWLRDKGFAVLALMRRGRGRSEGINGEENFARGHDGSVTDFSAGIAEAVEDLASAIAYGRKLPSVRQGPVLLAGQSRGGFLAMHYAGFKPSEVMAVVNFSGGWHPYAPLTTPYYANAGRSAADKVPQLWLYADNDGLYDEALIRGYYQAFTAAGGSARFQLLHGVPGDGHLLRLYPDRWRPIADQFLTTLDVQRP